MIKSRSNTLEHSKSTFYTLSLLFYAFLMTKLFSINIINVFDCLLKLCFINQKGLAMWDMEQEDCGSISGQSNRTQCCQSLCNISSKEDALDAGATTRYRLQRLKNKSVERYDCIKRFYYRLFLVKSCIVRNCSFENFAILSISDFHEKLNRVEIDSWRRWMLKITHYSTWHRQNSSNICSSIIT